MKKIHILLLILLLPLLNASCATVLTTSFPPEDSFDTGVVSVGERISSQYHLEKNETNYTLFKTPLCKEETEKVQVTKKRLRGIIPAICEIPLYGLGIADWIVADLYSRGTETRKAVGKQATGNIVTCGDNTIASNTDLILQFSDSDMVVHAKTNGDGHINLESALDKGGFNRQVNIFVRLPATTYYVTTIDNSFKY